MSGGHELERSKKFRDVVRTGGVGDRDRRSGEHRSVASAGDRGSRAGRGDALPTPMIRISPERIISWGLERGRSARMVAR
jgi:hypothetical protein